LIDSTDYGEGSDGTWRGNSTESNGYWFFNDDDTAGYWVSEDGQVTGDWTYDDQTTSTGTWWFEGDSSWIGTWATDESNDTIKYDSTDYGDYEDYTCNDLDNGEVNSYGETCAYYSQDGYEAECPYMDTDTFVAADLCCACGGGETVYTGDDSDDSYLCEGEECTSTDQCTEGLLCRDQADSTVDSGWVTVCVVFEAPTDYDGRGMDQYGETAGYWYLPASDAAEGTWIGKYGRETGFWSFDTDSDQTGVWRDSEGSEEGTFMKDPNNADVFIDTTPEDEDDTDWYVATTEG
jgi:hypothetical protein